MTDTNESAGLPEANSGSVPGPAAQRRGMFRLSSRNPGPRRQRSLQELLGSIVLAFEAIVVGLAALVINGLQAAPPAVALGGGAALCIALFATAALLRYPWAPAVGWVLQALVIVSGIYVAMMFVIGALFAALWTYAMFSGIRIDREKGRTHDGSH